MITQSQFNVSIEDAISLLKDMKLFKGRGLKTIGTYSDNSKKVAKSNRHTDIYKTAIENKDYEILLFDDSIFQFSWKNNELRFSFIQNPSTFVTKAIFLESIFDKEDFLDLSKEQLDDLILAVDEEEFEQFLNEQEINLNANIIRYDLTETGYSPLIHAYSHIHVGINPAFRVPCSKVLTPLKFVFFSIKHSYYHDWKDALQKIINFNTRLQASKNLCSNISANYWKHDETFELYLT